MTQSDMEQRLASMLKDAAKAHRQARGEEDSEDPNWAEWYASYLKPKLEALLSQSLTESEILFWLIGARRKHEDESSMPWPELFARFITEQLHLE